MNNILATFIAGYDAHNMITSPPERMLEVLVIAGVATLRVLPGDTQMDQPVPYDLDNPPPSIDVPARSLILALQAQIAEDELDDPPLEADGLMPG